MKTCMRIHSGSYDMLQFPTESVAFTSAYLPFHKVFISALSFVSHVLVLFAPYTTNIYTHQLALRLTIHWLPLEVYRYIRQGGACIHKFPLGFATHINKQNSQDILRFWKFLGSTLYSCLAPSQPESCTEHLSVCIAIRQQLSSPWTKRSCTQG